LRGRAIKDLKELVYVSVSQPTGRGRFQTGRGLTFFLLRIAQFNQISLKRFLIAGRGNFYLKNTGCGAIWVEKHWSK